MRWTAQYIVISIWGHIAQPYEIFRTDTCSSRGFGQNNWGISFLFYRVFFHGWIKWIKLTWTEPFQCHIMLLKKMNLFQKFKYICARDVNIYGPHCKLFFKSQLKIEVPLILKNKLQNLVEAVKKTKKTHHLGSRLQNNLRCLTALVLNSTPIVKTNKRFSRGCSKHSKPKAGLYPQGEAGQFCIHQHQLKMWAQAELYVVTDMVSADLD